MRRSLSYLVCTLVLIGCRRHRTSTPATTITAIQPVRRNQSSNAPSLKAIDVRFGNYLLRLEIHTTISPAGWLRSVRTDGKTYGPNDKGGPTRLVIREGQLAPAQIAELAGLFNRWDSLHDYYGTVPDGGEIEIRYGNKRVIGFTQKVTEVERRIRELADSMPRASS